MIKKIINWIIRTENRIKAYWNIALQSKLEKFFSLPVLAIYIYAVTVLVYSGYNKYFAIPQNFIELSLVFNLNFYKDFLIGTLAFLGLNKSISDILLTLTIIWLIIRWNSKTLATLYIIFFFVVFLSFMPWVGKIRAEMKTQFYTVKSGCDLIPLPKDLKYISPVIKDDKIIFIAIDSNRQIQQGFQIIDLTRQQCEIKLETIGTTTPYSI